MSGRGRKKNTTKIKKVATKKSGGARRKTTARKAKKLVASEHDKKAFGIVIDKINDTLTSIRDERERYFAHNYIDQFINIIYCNLRVFSIKGKSKTVKNVSHMRSEWDFVYKHIFDRDTGRFRKNSKFYRNNFEESGYKYIIACYESLYDDLLSHIFIRELKEYQAPPETDFKMQMARMGFMEMEFRDISRDDIYKAYRDKTLLYHPDRSEAREHPERYKIHNARTKRAFIMLDMMKNREMFLIKYPEENKELQKIIENMGCESSDEEDGNNTNYNMTNNIINGNGNCTTRTSSNGNVGDMSVFDNFDKHFGPNFLKQVSSGNTKSDDNVTVEVLNE
jgi:hypothetical protein